MDFEKTVSEKETDVIIKLQVEIDGLKEFIETLKPMNPDVYKRYKEFSKP